MTLSPNPHCSHCSKSSTSNKLLRCQGCNAVFYCGRDCQLADREDHKRACNEVKKTQQALSREERRLRSLPPDMFLPANLFEEHAGHFWGIHETRPYMRARYALLKALLKIKTHAAVKAAHENAMEMLRLCRSDNMGIRDLVPALYLRLGQDQECYDFCMWWVTTGNEGDYDWGDMNLPFLNIKGSNILDRVDPEVFRPYGGDLAEMVAFTLVKVRLLLTVRALYNSSLLAGRLPKLPQEIMDIIRMQVINDTPAANRVAVTNNDGQAALIRELEKQVQELYMFTDIKNNHFWRALLHPCGHLTARFDTYSPGSVEETQRALQYSYDAWMESPGAIDVIRDHLWKQDLAELYEEDP